ncbi:uncharacterized protein MELLADRAFT_101315 [Melampsora larici-populina 98AG31]|uniref:CCHC-type domain-containing protein n=1 Tax=Melampsora larici-populina (strain 98AG31 / pathotype 3-4-7) TaxID=747676 RepID=F4R4B9_MELLP|nr:uncharacterized protein MELLADRAFT_101315 [Melampsora larici-populina 98AG31]EGG12784.1 hypothetical protein MELLADRAFT_101315 [Melampsora larici-populina 98AG31]
MKDQLFIFDTSSDPKLKKFSNNHDTSTSKETSTPKALPIQSSSTLSPTKPIDQPQDRSIDFDLNDSAPSARRYWKEPTGITCTICQEPDHSAKNCEHELCLTCGAIDEHITRLCPVSLVCFACGSRGHLSRHCPSSSETRILGKDCIKCGSTNHLSLNCPSIWRCYEEIKIPNRKPKSLVPSCYNCGDNGDHFGDECPFGRHGRFRPEPSAFSIRAYQTDHHRHHSSHSRSSRYHHDHDDRYTLPPPRDSDYRSHDRYSDRPAPPSHQSRRPAPLPYEEEEEDWFSKRNRTTKKDIPTGPSKKPLQNKKKIITDHWEPKHPSNPNRKKNQSISNKIEIKTKLNNGRDQSQQSGKNGRVEEREAGDSSSNKRDRIGGTYKGGYTRR